MQKAASPSVFREQGIRQVSMIFLWLWDGAVCAFEKYATFLEKKTKKMLSSYEFPLMIVLIYQKPSRAAELLHL